MSTAINTSTGTTAASALSAAEYMKKTTGLNKDDFMKLFITQLQNQDPLAPTDSSAMVGQMAQITQVEQSYNTNTHLQSLLSAANNSAQLSAVSYIGKTVLAQGSQVSLTAGSEVKLPFNLAIPAAQLKVIVQDAKGTAVRILSQGGTAAGDGTVAWDGKDGNGKALPTGLYSFSVAGLAADGSSFSGTPLVKGVVDGVTMVQGESVLTAGGINIPLASVMTIKN